VDYQRHTKLVESADTTLDLSASLGFSRELIWMKNRSRAYIRHQRERMIQKKWAILQNVMLQENEYMPVRGTLSKGKVHCSCRMCRYEQYHSIPKAKHKAKLKAMEQEIDDDVYFLLVCYSFIP